MPVAARVLVVASEEDYASIGAHSTRTAMPVTRA